MDTLPFKNILIDGLPRTGKKELGRKLSSKFHYTLISESPPDEIINYFYNDIEKNALLTELTFLIQRHKQLSTILSSDLYEPNSTIFTFSLEKSRIYASYTLNNYEYAIFNKIYEMLAKTVQLKYNLVIITYAEPKEILKRINQNPKNGEEKISEEYIEDLTKVFYNHYSKISGTITVFADTENYENGFGEEWINNLIAYLKNVKPGLNMFEPLHP